MKKLRTLAAALLAVSLLMTACGGEDAETEPDTETTADTSADTEMTEETEAETETETTAETKKSYTNFITLTVADGDNSPVFDTETGMFVIRFTEENVRFAADDACAVGIAGGGEAYSIEGSIDTEAYPELVNGDYYTGVAIKPSEALESGKYRFTITFGMYLVSFDYTIS